MVFELVFFFSMRMPAIIREQFQGMSAIYKQHSNKSNTTAQPELSRLSKWLSLPAYKIRGQPARPGRIHDGT